MADRREDNREYKLVLALRVDERRYAEALLREYGNPTWIDVEYPSDSRLAELLNTASIGMIALERNPYFDSAISHKLYTYASHGMPILATNNDAMRSIIQENGIGEVFDSALTFWDAVERMQNHYQGYVAHVWDFAVRNTWTNRVDTVVTATLNSQS